MNDLYKLATNLTRQANIFCSLFIKEVLLFAKYGRKMGTYPFKTLPTATSWSNM